MIPFNKPFLTGKENLYIEEAVNTGKISGNGLFTKKCHEFFESKYGFQKTLMTTSCTDALEMCAILVDIKPGDEVIVPSYTFVSTALAFIRQGAKIIFADSRTDTPGIDEEKVEKLVSDKTRAIVVVHYAGIAVDMDKIMSLSEKYGFYVIEDAAQAIDSFYKGQPLGGIGHLGAFSFHETKNIISGEGGLLIINDDKFIDRSEIIWEKGTNRSAFFKGEIDKYGWVDLGSSFLPSELISAFLFAQLEKLKEIQGKRTKAWSIYYEKLEVLQTKGKLKLPTVPKYATNNAHMFYVLTKSLEERDEFIAHLRQNGIHAVFHYLSLHKSQFYLNENPESKLIYSDYYSDTLVRLPLFYEITETEILAICETIIDFYK